ncbi:MAG: HAMP domain-containing sensor histidine kinase [Acidobacteriota bacterium]|nr:HAMP domain-containing sensor histidine kinase [Acidobacteriota bacterium]
MERNKDRFKLALVALWLIFTMTLATWWLIFSLRQLNELQQLTASITNAAPTTHHYYSMLLWEGAVLIGLLVIGGVTLISYVWSERRRHRQSEEFFAAFTHDAKTALTSLRLQAESLREDFGDEQSNPVLDRLLKDTLRLQLQLENSLFLVNLQSGRLLIEPLRISRLIESLRFHWPELSLVLQGDGAVLADARALESVLTNLIQNAVIHGRAQTIKMTVESTETRQLRISVADDGKGFSGDYRQLGTLFLRSSRSSGSGVGLYISQQLMKRMGGLLEFAPGEQQGFVAHLNLPQVQQETLARDFKRVIT